MHRIEVSYKTLSPVILLTQSPDQSTVSTLEYLPGASVLGAFARLYQDKREDDSALERDPQFREWFLAEDFQFTDAHFVLEKNGRFYPSLPAPMSLQWTKEGKAFFHPGLTKEEEKQTPTKPKQKGIFVDKNRRYALVSPRKQSAFHHQRSDYRNGHGGDNSIFHYQALSDGQVFRGYIHGRKDLLEAFMTKMDQKGLLMLGRSKGTQYGRVFYEMGPIEPVPPLVHDAEDLDVKEIDLRFLSPVLLRNEQGCYAPDAHLLEKALGHGIEITHAYIRTRSIESFVSAWHMKKPAILAIERGSACRIRASFDSPEGLKSWLEKLKEGIGERRNEGYGQLDVLVDWDGDWQEINESDFPKEAFRKPDTQLTSRGVQMMRIILEERLKQEISSLALKKSDIQSEKIPVPHILSRVLTVIEQAGSIEDVSKTVERFKDKAKNSLEKCLIDNVSLLDLLKINHDQTTPTPFRVEELQISELKKLLTEYPELGEFKIGTEWIKLYWRELIRYLRIRKKQGEQGGDRG